MPATDLNHLMIDCVKQRDGRLVRMDGYQLSDYYTRADPALPVMKYSNFLNHGHGSAMADYQVKELPPSALRTDYRKSAMETHTTKFIPKIKHLHNGGRESRDAAKDFEKTGSSTRNVIDVDCSEHSSIWPQRSRPETKENNMDFIAKESNKDFPARRKSKVSPTVRPSRNGLELTGRSLNQIRIHRASLPFNNCDHALEPLNNCAPTKDG